MNVPQRRAGNELWKAISQRVDLALLPGWWRSPPFPDALIHGVTALAAVLRQLPELSTRELVERAVSLVLNPSLLASKLPLHQRATWRTLIGPEDMKIPSVLSLCIPWDAVLRRAAIEHVLAIDEQGLWGAGEDVGDAPCTVLDARALVALTTLDRLSDLRALLAAVP